MHEAQLGGHSRLPGPAIGEWGLGSLVAVSSTHGKRGTQFRAGADGGMQLHSVVCGWHGW